MKRLLKSWIAQAVLSIGIVSAVVGASYGQDKVIRIGFQKYGKLVLLKGRGTLEEKLKPLGYTVSWTEFPSGPPLLEALNVGAIDFGVAGEAPPIFAQAAGAPLVYLANDPPAPRGDPGAEGKPAQVGRRPSRQEGRFEQGIQCALSIGARPRAGRTEI
jgi:sulfonate transport system substrate-binding protein